MKKKGINKFARLIYALVGMTGIASLLWAIFNWDKFTAMPSWSIIAFVIAVIGSINWGIVTITNDRNKDLFGLLSM